MRTIVRILSIDQVTADVKCFRVEKPAGYIFVPGQATDVSVNAPGSEEELRPFTFTGLNEHPYLEFTIKRYKDHHGVTDKLHDLIPGNEIIIGEPWGAIEFTSPGYFIAGGAGITPFIAILRSLHQQNKISGNLLFFSNKTAEDIIYINELKKIMGNQVIFNLTREQKAGFEKGRIDKNYLEKHINNFDKCFYVCGPDDMVAELVQTLKTFGADPSTLVFEK